MFKVNNKDTRTTPLAKSNTQDLTISNRFSVLARENASDLQPPSLNIDLQEQSCTRKETTSLRENTLTPNNDKESDRW